MNKQKLIAKPTYQNRIQYYAGGGDVTAVGAAIDNMNPYVRMGLDFVPLVGTGLAIRDAWNDPSLKNIGMAALSAVGDLTGTKFLVGALKGAKALKAAKYATRGGQKELEKLGTLYKSAGRGKISKLTTKASDWTIDHGRGLANALPNLFNSPLKHYRAGVKGSKMLRSGKTKLQKHWTVEKELADGTKVKKLMTAPSGVLGSRDIGRNAEKLADQIGNLQKFVANSKEVEKAARLARNKNLMKFGTIVAAPRILNRTGATAYDWITNQGYFTPDITAPEVGPEEGVERTSPIQSDGTPSGYRRATPTYTSPDDTVYNAHTGAPISQIHYKFHGQG